MREPWFWREKTLTAQAVSTALSPLGTIYNAGQRLKWRSTSCKPAPLPVICIGNATVGGVGKTPFALMLSKLLKSHQVNSRFLTRGYGGKLTGPVLVDIQQHNALDVGDEALLLAKAAPCWIARNRAEGAEKAAASGAHALIMDDGFQNQSLEKSFSFLLVSNDDPIGNGHVFPAGSMREPFQQALGRADAVVSIKNSPDTAIQDYILNASKGLPIFSAWLQPQTEGLPKKVVAFCGIGRPERFFKTLENCDVEIAERYSFSDHHRYSTAELARLRQVAKKERAVLLTTEKDYVRLPEKDRADIEFLPVSIVVDDPTTITALTLEAIDTWRIRNGVTDGAN